MELRHLRYFVAVAEELNFTRAAERLAISQPPLSAQIRQLEEEFGSQLLNRSSRGVSLTSAGKLLLEEARLILKQVDATKTAVSKQARSELGGLILGSAGGTYFHPLIPQIIQEYRKRYTDIVLTPHASSTALLAARLRMGKIDVAFIRPLVGDPSGLAFEPMVREPAVVVLPKGHSLCKLTSIPLSALAQENFVQFQRELNPDNYDLLIEACRAAGFVPRIAQEAPDALAIVPLVVAGLGVSIVPSSVSRILRDEICCVPLERDAPMAQIHLAYRRKETSRAVKDFVRTAREVLAKDTDG